MKRVSARIDLRTGEETRRTKRSPRTSAAASERIAREMVYCESGEAGAAVSPRPREEAPLNEQTHAGGEARAVHRGLGLLGHHARVQLEVVDVLVQLLGCARHSLVRVPLGERAVLLEAQVAAEPARRARGWVRAGEGVSVRTATTRVFRGERRRGALVERAAAPDLARRLHPEHVDGAHDLGRACERRAESETSLSRERKRDTARDVPRALKAPATLSVASTKTLTRSSSLRGGARKRAGACQLSAAAAATTTSTNTTRTGTRPIRCA